VNRRQLAWRAGMTVLFLIIGWRIYIALGAQLRELSWEDFRHYKPAAAPLAFSVLLLVTANVLHAFLWRRISVDLGSPAPNARATLHIYFVSSLSRYVVKLGQMAGLAVLAAKFGMAAGRATAAALLGQLVFMIVGFLFVSLAAGLGEALCDGCNLPGLRTAMPSLPFDPAIIGVLLALGTVAAIWILVATAAGHRLRDWIVGRFHGRTGEKLHTAFRVIDEARPADAAVWTTGYAASWLLLAGAFAMYVRAFVPIGPGHVVWVGGVAAASYLLGYFSPTPAGLGAREGIMILLLKALMPLPAAVVIAVLSRFWFTAGEVLPLLLIPISGKPAVAPASAAAAGSGAAR
jgi:glycosyltransferase 2 family protein